MHSSVIEIRYYAEIINRVLKKVKYVQTSNFERIVSAFVIPVPVTKGKHQQGGYNGVHVLHGTSLQPHYMQRKIFFTPKARLGCSDDHKLIGCAANWYIPLSLEFIF